jgi:3'(2'), 5'-bisphosphate nucleotidase
LKICLVAEGRADIYPRLAPTMEWDTAAGHAVAQYAGTRIYEYESGETLRYNKENLLNPWFIIEGSSDPFL